MNILFLTQVLPYPLDAGPKVRAYYVLRYLAEAGHRITLVSMTRESDTESSIDHLRSFCHEVHPFLVRRSRVRDLWHLGGSLASRRPFIISRDWFPRFVRLVAGLTSSKEPFDAVHSDQLWMAPYALQVQQSRPAKRRPMTVLDQHNAVYKIPLRLAEAETNPLKRLLLGLEARKMQRFEKQICGEFDRLVWVTEEDRNALFPAGLPEERAGKRDLVIPICVSPRGGISEVPAGLRKRVTFIGGLHWPPNKAGILWFRDEVWPRVFQQRPDLVLTVIGKEPGPELESLPPSVEVKGYVADPEPWLRETSVFIVPLHAGGGMRVKILEAWSRGLPVVSTGIGAEGIQTSPGENLLLADNAQDFADAVISVVQDPQLGKRLAEGGCRTLENRYSWRSAYRLWDQVYPCESSTSFLTHRA